MKNPTILLLALGVHIAFGQVELTDKPANNASALFDVDAISFVSDSSALSRLDIFAAIPYEQLSFVKKDGAFVASYEMTFGVYDEKNALVNEKLWTKEIKVASFDRSVSSGSYAVEQRSILLPAGKYQLAFLLRDIESRNTRRVRRELTVGDYAKPGLSLSDIMLVGRLAVQDDGRKSITPGISPNVGAMSSPFHIFFEAYNTGRSKTPDGSGHRRLVERDTLNFVTSVLNMKNEQVQVSDTTIALSEGRNQLFLHVDQSALPIGDYKLFVHAYAPSSSTPQQSLANTSRSFIVRWKGMPKGVKDIDLATDQLAYIAKEKELDYIKAASTQEEKQKRFLEFWKKKDPNPNTIRNEKMEEHYARVEYANKNFKHYTDGWRTDMGMVYIIFGSPNNVERHPFDSDSKPYEVWAYYEVNYNFVFVDQTGFGDYRLTTPIWDVWQRPRN